MGMCIRVHIPPISTCLLVLEKQCFKLIEQWCEVIEVGVFPPALGLAIDNIEPSSLIVSQPDPVGEVEPALRPQCC